MGHSGRPHLLGAGSLAEEFVAGHQADRGCRRGRTGGHPEQARDDVEVQRPRIYLTGGAQGRREAEPLSQGRLEGIHLAGVAAKQRQQVGLRAYRTFQATQRVPLDEGFEPADRVHQLLASGREATPVGGDLRRHVVRACGHRQRRRFSGTAGG